MEIGNAVKNPTTDSSWIKKVIIGGILLIIPIVNILVIGYAVNVIKRAIANEAGMPEWKDWGNLFIKGLVFIVIDIIYMIIPMIVLMITAGGVIVAASSGGPNAMMAALSGAFAGLAVSGILFLIAGLMLPMAIAMYAKEDSFGAAFRLKEVLSRIKSVIGGYILAIIVLIVLNVILNIIFIIPILGWIIMLFGSFYILNVAGYMYGKLYSESSA